MQALINAETNNPAHGGSGSLISELYDITKCGTLTFCPAVQDQNDNVSIAVKRMLNSYDVSVNGFKSELRAYDFIGAFQFVA